MRRSMRGHFTSLFNKGKSDISSLCRSVDRCWSCTRQDSTFAAGEPIRNSCVIASTAEWQPAITGKTDAVDFAGF
jgi:hypothetical protein